MINFLRQNLFLKGLSLLLALGLWLYVMNEQNPSITSSVSVQLSIINAPDGYQIHHDSDTIKLVLKAPRSAFAAVDNSDFKAYVDLANVQEGEQTLPVHIQLPAGFELISSTPENVKFVIDEIIQKQIPIDLILSGKPADDMVVADTKQSADTIVVKGPRTQVDQVRKAIGYIGLDNNKDDFTVIVPLRAVDDNNKEVSDVTLLSSTVNASITLAHGLTHKVVAVRPIADSDLPTEFTLDSLKATPDKVEITGNPQVISTINSLDTAKISLAKMTGSGEQTVNLAVPDGITVSTNTVKVSIKISEKEPVKQGDDSKN